MFCPKCGKELSDQEKFCSECGTAVSPKASIAPERAAPVKPVEIYPVEEMPLARKEASTAIAVKPAKGSKVKALVIVAVAIVAALILAAVLFSSKDPADDVSTKDLSENEIPDQEGTDVIAPVPDATAEFLKYIDQAEELLQKANDDYNALSEAQSEDGTYGQIWRDRAQIWDSLVVELGVLQEQANAIKGVDAKMQSAGKEYFSMLCDSRKSYSQINTFLADYLDFFDQTVAYRPLEVDYDSLQAYSEDLSAWVQEAKEGYAALSCPSCMESEWKQYGKILEYNDSIATKVQAAIVNNDWLRYYSTKNMTTRYMTVEEALYGKFLDCMKGEQDHAARQSSVSTNLAEEMHAYAEMDQEEKDVYEFDYNRAGKIWVSFDAVDTIYPSLYNTYDAFVIVKTGCVSGNRTIVVEAEIPGFTQKYQELFRLDSAYKAIYIKPPALTGELDLSSAKDAQINVTISEQDGTLIDAKSFPVTIKSKYDFEWYSGEYGISTQDNILCFLTPESAAVAELKRQAIDEISVMTGGVMESFVGYQNVNPNWNQYTITYLQAAGLMNALYEMGVRYNMDPFSLSGSNQHILFPADVIAQKSGLCIETSLMIASALQSAGMHAFLLFPPGHAQVAVEVWKNGDNAGEYFLIETTSLTGSTNNKQHFVDNANSLLEWNGCSGVITYYNADNWYDYLENSVDYIIDCEDSRLLGLTPFAN